MTSVAQHTSSVVLLLFCFIVLLVSLFTSNRMQTGQSARLPATRMYLSEQILPDNALYLPLMVRDRVRLVTTAKEEQVFLKLEYAEARYQSAVALVDKGQEQLAITTMTKSQKYLLQAVYQVRADKEAYSLEERVRVKATLGASVYRLEVLQDAIASDDSALEALQTESAIVFQQFDIF